MVPITHEQNIICSKTRLDGTTHEQTIIRKQLLAGHVVDSRPKERKKKTHRMIIPFSELKPLSQTRLKNRIWPHKTQAFDNSSLMGKAHGKVLMEKLKFKALF